MFNTAEKKAEAIKMNKIDTIIGEDAVVEGLLKTVGTSRIDGTLKGDGQTEGLLIVGETGVVEGNAVADSMLIAGTIYGNLYAKERLEIADTGKVMGDIVTKLLIVAEGASFEGKSSMGAEAVNTHMILQEKEVKKHDTNNDCKTEIRPESSELPKEA